MIISASANALALGLPAIYFLGTDLGTVILYAFVSSSLIFSLAFYLLAIRPLSKLMIIMQELCASVTNHPQAGNQGNEMALLEEGLRCISRQWETSRRKIEESGREEIVRMEKLATLGEMAFSVAHDIKNPLAGISGAIQVFSEDFAEDDPRREIVREILDEIGRLDRTVKDLQLYARPPEPHPLPTPAIHLLERVLNSVSENAKKSRVDVNILECSESLEVDVDTELIHQALMNIMDFSIKALEGGGDLTLTARGNQERDTVDISIRDNGPGLKKENMDSLFRPFRTSRMSTSGLSMAISRSLVEINGGHIEVESSEGTGTTFRIVLPRYRENA